MHSLRYLSSYGWCFSRDVPAACLQPSNSGLLASLLPSDVWSLSLVRQKPLIASHKTEKVVKLARVLPIAAVHASYVLLCM